MGIVTVVLLSILFKKRLTGVVTFLLMKQICLQKSQKALVGVQCAVWHLAATARTTGETPFFSFLYVYTCSWVLSCATPETQGTLQDIDVFVSHPKDEDMPCPLLLGHDTLPLPTTDKNIPGTFVFPECLLLYMV